LELEETPEEEGANVDLDAAKTQCAVIKTSTRATYFLPVVGLVDSKELKPGDLVGVNKDSYLVLEKLPPEYDSRVKAMEVDERPTEQYSDIGGCDKQITELIEAVVLPMTHKDRFINLGIQPPKGVLLYGPPVSRLFAFYMLDHICREPERPCWRVLLRLKPNQPF
jgi:26S proteasome regulatory subunit T5